MNRLENELLFVCGDQEGQKTHTHTHMKRKKNNNNSYNVAVDSKHLGQKRGNVCLCTSSQKYSHHTRTPPSVGQRRFRK